MRSLQLLFATVVTSASLPATAQLRANDPQKWITTSDAPFVGASETQAGIMRFYLSVSNEGILVGCRLAYGSGPIPKSEAICSLLKQRARYRIAGDSSGRPTNAVDAVSYRFSRSSASLSSDFGGARPIKPEQWITNADYPSDALRARAEGDVAFSFKIRADGRASECRVTVPSGYDSLNFATCKLITARARFIAPRDEAGRPAATRGSAVFAWRLQR